MTKILYRSAHAQDADAIATLHAASWRDAYRDILDKAYLDGPIEQDRLAHWNKLFADPEINYFIMIGQREDGVPIGFVAVDCDPDPTWGALVDNLHVLPETRGRGIGATLLRMSAAHIAAADDSLGLYLWVYEKNTGAADFYRHLGGEIVERAVLQSPPANGQAVLRVHWPSVASLARRELAS